jgi:S1-C subfamily serine protease
VRRLLPLLVVALLAPSVGHAARKKKPQPVPVFYETAGRTLATVEFVQEYLAGGQRQQTRGYTDGFVISADGLVLISGRVRFPQRSGSRLTGGSLPELSDFLLHFSDGRELRAEVLGFENDLNLGLLRIVDVPAGGLPHIQWREGYDAQVGDGLRTLTLYTEEFGRKPVFSGLGVNARLDTPQDVWSLSGASSDILGAPLCDDQGHVVGVVAEVPMSAWAGRQVMPDLSGPVGLSYDRFKAWIAQTVTEEKQVAAQQEEDDDAAWLGVMFEPLDRDLAKHLKVSDGGGVIVSRVVPGSPAEAVGLQPLDILVAMDGARIGVQQDADTAQFARQIRERKAGSTVVFTRERPGGATDDVPIVLVQAPRSELHAERRTDDEFELTVRELTTDTLLAQRLPPGTPGVVVDGLTRAGWAGLSGLRQDSIIQRINEHDVVDLEGFTAAMDAIAQERPGKVLFFVRYGRNTGFFVAEPNWDDVGR